MNDQELVTKLKADDQNAFKQLYEKYHHLVYNICYRMSDNREEAEDTTQDVFIKIYQGIGTFRGEAKLTSWMYRIAVNTCLKRERRKKLVSWVSLDFLFQEEGTFQPHSPDEIPDQKVETLEKEQIVQQAIQTLPAHQKTALILRRYEYLSYKEIAEVLEISLPAVESLLHRAKENLASKLIPLKKFLQ